MERQRTIAFDSYSVLQCGGAFPRSTQLGNNKTQIRQLNLIESNLSLSLSFWTPTHSAHCFIGNGFFPFSFLSPLCRLLRRSLLRGIRHLWNWGGERILLSPSIHPSIRLAPVKSDVSILPKSIRLLLFVGGNYPVHSQSGTGIYKREMDDCYWTVVLLSNCQVRYRISLIRRLLQPATSTVALLSKRIQLRCAEFNQRPRLSYKGRQQLPHQGGEREERMSPSNRPAYQRDLFRDLYIHVEGKPVDACECVS